MPATPVASTQMTGGSAPGTVLADPTPTAIDTTNGNAFTNSGQTMFRVQNTDTASHVLTLLTPVTEDGLPLQDDPRTIPATSTKWIGRLPVAIYGSKLQMTCTSALVEVTAFEP
jgi:hypothetical protein